jgi:hypothetical protein
MESEGRGNTDLDINMDFVKQRLNSFNKLEVLKLESDAAGNLVLVVPWYDRCTYFLLRLSPDNTLLDLKKEHYQNYIENWYLHTECAERRK